MIEIRKTITLRETVLSELGVEAARPITRAVGMVVFRNPFAGQFVEDLRPLFEAGAMLGKRLMMHPFGTVVGLFEDDLGSTQGPWGQHLHCLEFYETDTSRGFVRGAKWGLQPTGGPT